jgi:hypothetical protein
MVLQNLYESFFYVWTSETNKNFNTATGVTVSHENKSYSFARCENWF